MRRFLSSNHRKEWDLLSLPLPLLPPCSGREGSHSSRQCGRTLVPCQRLSAQCLLSKQEHESQEKGGGKSAEDLQSSGQTQGWVYRLVHHHPLIVGRRGRPESLKRLGNHKKRFVAWLRLRLFDYRYQLFAHCNITILPTFGKCPCSYLSGFRLTRRLSSHFWWTLSRPTRFRITSNPTSEKPKRLSLSQSTSSKNDPSKTLRDLPKFVILYSRS